MSTITMTGKNKHESVLSALQEFKTSFELAKVAAPLNATGSSGNSDKPVPTLEITSLLQEYLKEVSKSGVTLHPWKVVKPLFLCKMDQVMRWYDSKQPLNKVPAMPNSTEQTFKVFYTRILQSANSFKQAPFTVQRLCELLCYPEQHYKRIDKFLHALEKNISVVTTVDEESRKICTGSDLDVGPEQTDKVLALFNWMHATQDTDNTENMKPPENKESQLPESSTSAGESSSQMEHISSSSEVDANNSATSLTPHLSSKSLKRCLGDGDSQNADAKRVKLESDTSASSAVENSPSKDSVQSGTEATVSSTRPQEDCGNDPTASPSSSSEAVHDSSNSSNDDNTSGDCDSISDSTSADTVDQDDLPQSNTMTAETSTLQTPADQPAADQPAADQPADMPTSDSNLNETSSVTDSVEAKDTSQSEATSSLEREADQPNSAVDTSDN